MTSTIVSPYYERFLGIRKLTELLKLPPYWEIVRIDNE